MRLSAICFPKEKKTIKRLIYLLLDSLRLGPFAAYYFQKFNYLRNLSLQKQNEKLKQHEKVPLPPPELAFTVMGSFSLEDFLQGGKTLFTCINKIFKNQNVNVNDFEKILEFGCGCGRVLRYWDPKQGPSLFGTDINSKLIEWCSANLPFVKISLNSLNPPMSYDDDYFDFVYAISVFTHLNEPRQKQWLNELKRVLKPKGYLLLSLHGKSHAEKHLDEQQKKHFQSGKLVVVNGKYNSKNACAVFHPKEYVQKLFSRDFEIVDYDEKGADGQDALLIRLR
jgi:SAM-dependent methyltransferase